MIFEMTLKYTIKEKKTNIIMLKKRNGKQVKEKYANEYAAFIK